MSALALSVAGISIISFAYFRLSSSVADLSPSYALFDSENSYYRYIKENVSFEGVELRMVTIMHGDNFWKIAREYGVNIDTLISANPYWQTLNARENQTVIVPTQKGVLHFICDFSQIGSVAKIYGVEPGQVLIQKIPFLYRLYSWISENKRPIAVFVRNARPEESMMKENLAKQFAVREMFRSPLGGRYSSFFGQRLDPIVHTGQFHNGVDIAALMGTPVGAACDGVVSDTGWMGGFGNAVVVDHRNGYRTLYGHLSLIGVRRGQSVRAGQFVGRVGSTGWSTGPHLHFTLWQNGRYINPMQVLW
jgi:murein DD-endopeptidase MepM/ murein hydrolase activator NlpD